MAPIIGTLYRLFGWFDQSATNRTKREIENPHGKGPLGGAVTHDGYKASLSMSGNPIQRMMDAEEMAQSDLIAPIVAVYTEECTQPDVVKGKALWYECADSTIEDELNDMLERIQNEDKMPIISDALTCGGNKFMRILTNEKGVVGFEAEDRVRRVFDPISKRLYGFIWEGQEPEFAPYENSPQVFAPWEFVHFRRLTGRGSQYGEGLLDFLFATWRKLDLSMDQMVMYRLHTMPTRYAVKVDIGDQDTITSHEQVHQFKQAIRSQVNTDGKTQLTTKYSPPSIESMIFIPVRKDEQTEITHLPGTTEVPDIHDIEELTKQLYGGARVPKAYLGHGDDGAGLAQASLVSQDIRFARMIRHLRRPIISGYLTLAHIHLSLTGRDPSQYKIKVKMSKISSLEDEINTAATEKQAALASNIAHLCLDLGIQRRDVIELIFNEYLKLPRKFIELAKLGMSISAALGTGEDQDGGMGPGGGGMGPPIIGGPGGDLGGDIDMGPSDLPDAGAESPGLEDDLAKAETTRQFQTLKPLFEHLHEGSRCKVSILHESKSYQEFEDWRREVSELHFANRVSLVDSYQPSIDTNQLPPIKQPNLTLTESVKALSLKLPDRINLSADKSPDNQEIHESVSIVRAARKKRD